MKNQRTHRSKVKGNQREYFTREVLLLAARKRGLSGASEPDAEWGPTSLVRNLFDC